MLDDDSKLVGTRSSSGNPFRATTDVQTQSSIQTGEFAQLSGLFLHVDQCGDQPAHTLQFRRSQITVNIGRKPSIDEGTSGDGSDPCSAMFRCPVVSRKHAKIVFSEGHAYLIDLHSYHGTHVRKAADTVSIPLVPEVPYVLVNGDTVTFGKSVESHSILVRPVTARVELLFESQTLERVPEPLALSPVLLTPPLDNRHSPKSSGCYGIHGDDNSSPSWSSSEDLDIEDLPLSSDKLDQAPRSEVPEHRQSSETPLTRIYNDIISCILPRRDGESHSPSTFPRISTPILRPSTIGISNPLRWFPDRLSNCSPASADQQPQESPACGSEAREAETSVVEGSTGSAPMDLSSPPTPTQRPCEPDACEGSQPPLQGQPVDAPLAHADVPTESISTAVLPWAPALVPDISHVASEPCVDAPVFTKTVVSMQNSQCMVEPVVSDQSDAREVITSGQFNDIPITDCSEMVLAGNKVEASGATACDHAVSVQDLRVALAPLQVDINKLRSQRRRYKARFEENARITTRLLIQLEKRAIDNSELYRSLLERLDMLCENEIATLQVDLHMVQEQVDRLQDTMFSYTEDKIMKIEEVQTAISNLDALHNEYKLLRDKAVADLNMELEAFRRARFNAALTPVDAGAQANPSAANASAPPDGMQSAASSPSLKRKRSVSGDDGVDCDAARDDCTTQHSGDPPMAAPRPKRARSIVSGVVHTATAVTLGAVAAWGVLAFT